jgi:hypothetical protein
MSGEGVGAQERAGPPCADIQKVVLWKVVLLCSLERHVEQLRLTALSVERNIKLCRFPIIAV